MSDAMRIADLSESIEKALDADARYQAALSWPKFVLNRHTREHVHNCLVAAYEIGKRSNGGQTPTSN